MYRINLFQLIYVQFTYVWARAAMSLDNWGTVSDVRQPQQSGGTELQLRRPLSQQQQRVTKGGDGAGAMKLQRDWGLWEEHQLWHPVETYEQIHQKMFRDAAHLTRGLRDQVHVAAVVTSLWLQLVPQLQISASSETSKSLNITTHQRV